MTEAPPAPVAAPAAPPTPSNRAGGPNMDTAFAGFDSLVAGETGAPASGTAQTDPDPKSQTPDPKASPDPKPQAQDPKTTPDPKPQTPDPKAAPKPIKAATLREELDRTRAEINDWKSKYEKAVAESKTAKADPEKEQLLKDREAWNKTRTELENELKYSNYERSAEYKEKYQQPFYNAYEQGKKIITALTMKEPDQRDEFGAVTQAGASRKGTEADWERLMSITDEDAANKFIADNFGHNAARVTIQRDKVLDLHGQMRTAVDTFRKTSGERETQLKDTQTKAQQETRERWTAANKMAQEKFPQYFAPDETDPKGNDLLSHGSRLTDLAFGALDPSEFSKLPQSLQDKMVNGELPAHEKTMLHAAIRNRSAAYDRMIYRLTQKEAELKAVQEKLAGYEKSEPGPGQTRRVETPGGKTSPKGTFDDVDNAFDRLAAGNS